MDGLLRRRVLGEVEVEPLPISSLPLSFYATSGFAWNSTTKKATFTSGSATWHGLLLQGLTMKCSHVFANYSHFSIDFDLTLSWDVSKGGDGLILNIGAYNTANPRNNSTHRKAGWNVKNIGENGTYHVHAERDLRTISWNDYSDDYFGYTFFINGVGSGTISNIEMGVY